jgi:hypothetical protein
VQFVSSQQCSLSAVSSAVCQQSAVQFVSSQQCSLSAVSSAVCP